MARTTLNRAARRQSVLARTVVWIVVVLALVLVVAVLGTYAWVKKYLAGDDFRAWLAARAGSELQAEVKIEPLVWNRLKVQTSQIEAKGSGALARLQIEDPQATISLGALTSGVWVVDNASAGRVVLDLKTPVAGAAATSHTGPGAGAVADEEAAPTLPGWFPTKVSVPQIQVREASVRFGAGEMDFRILRSGMRMDEHGGDSWDIALRGGQFRVAPFPGAGIKDKSFAVLDGSLRITPEWVYVLGSTMRGDDGSTLKIEGKLPGREVAGGLDVHAAIRDLPVAQVLGPQWVNRVFGRLSIDNRSFIEDGKLVHEGTAGLADAKFLTPQSSAVADVSGAAGILERGWQSLTGTVIPVLGAYTDHSVQFRNLVCDTAGCRYRIIGDRMEIDAIEVRSRGLLGIEGALTIAGDKLTGELMVGVTRAVLAGIPGAEAKVFTIERDGLVWTPVKVSGTLDKPEEDLTRRLVEAAGARVLDGVPGLRQLTETLPDIDVPGAIKDGAGDLLDKGGQLLDAVLPKR